MNTKKIIHLTDVKNMTNSMGWNKLAFDFSSSLSSNTHSIFTYDMPFNLQTILLTQFLVYIFQLKSVIANYGTQHFNDMTSLIRNKQQMYSNSKLKYKLLIFISKLNKCFKNFRCLQKYASKGNKIRTPSSPRKLTSSPYPPMRKLIVEIMSRRQGKMWWRHGWLFVRKDILNKFQIPIAIEICR